jgi:signal transduction histidine kinase/ABC-type sulfate/molybdate transport systems ATPase subunit
VLRVRGLQKRFGRLDVLRGIDLDLRRGEILALVGENGSGKSTVVRCLARTDSIDAGTVELGGQALAADPIGARDQGLAVVWQDLALCDNLSVVANLFLGDERVDRFLLSDVAMLNMASALFRRLKLPATDLQRPVGLLSGGQRQLVAIACAVRLNPTVLALDEPTASLGVNETAVVDRLLAELRDAGTAILLVSHRLEQVFALADRIAILRDGRIRAVVSPLEVHPDDVVAMISGITTESTARRQLQRLRSLVEQLGDVDPGASLPLIVSAMVEALAVEQLCVHLLDQRDHALPRRGSGPTEAHAASGPGALGAPGAISRARELPGPTNRSRLRRSAAMGLSASLMEAVESLPVDADGGPPGLAAATGDAVVVEDMRTEPLCARFRSGEPSEPRSSWSVPIVGADGVLGTITVFADTVGRPRPDQLELVGLYASHAAAAIERERLLADATRRNLVLETLRGVLDMLAGPQPTEGGLALALLALCRGLGADAIALHHADGQASHLAPTPLGEAAAARSADQQGRAAALVLATSRLNRARPVGPDVIAVPIAAPGGRTVVTVWWADTGRLSDEALDLLDDAARSLRLALEREALERAHAEAESLRRSQQMQRDFLSRLNHELRTPLTAIQGYASTLRQQDVSWDVSSQERFLDSIASESARMGRLVGDLLDFSAIDSGTLRLVPDWCDLGLVLQAACRCVTDGPGSPIELVDSFALPPVWADHDRLEQVFVNLVDNALRHGSGLTKVTVSAQVSSGGDLVTVRVTDDGPGIPRDLAERVFLPHERGVTSAPGAGLGLAIARGIVDAHGGTITLEPVAGGTSVAVILPVEPVEPVEAGEPLKLGETVEAVEAVSAGEPLRPVGAGEAAEPVSTPLTDTSTGSEGAASDAAPTPLPALG